MPCVPNFALKVFINALLKACLLQVTIPQNDPLFQLKRSLLQKHNLATQQRFQFRKNQASSACKKSTISQWETIA